MLTRLKREAANGTASKETREATGVAMSDEEDSICSGTGLPSSPLSVLLVGFCRL